MSRGVLVWAVSIGAIVWSAPSHASNPNAIKPSDYGAAPVARYAGMDGAGCLQELDRRQIAYNKAAAVPGVETPVRFSGPVHGIVFSQLNRSAEEALNSDSAITDCRLALALDDFAAKLQPHRVVEVGFISAYRHDSTGTVKPGERHPAGLAIDVAWLRKDDGTELNILRDFHGRVGARTCGMKADPPRVRTDGATELRAIVCSVADDRLFNLVLTPNYNREHHNHVHLEVRRNIDWILVQ